MNNATTHASLQTHRPKLSIMNNVPNPNNTDAIIPMNISILMLLLPDIWYTKNVAIPDSPDSSSTTPR